MKNLKWVALAAIFTLITTATVDSTSLKVSINEAHAGCGPSASELRDMGYTVSTFHAYWIIGEGTDYEEIYEFYDHDLNGFFEREIYSFGGTEVYDFVWNCQ